MQVSAAYLLRGAWYAFEQAGRLIDHSVILYDKHAHSSAVVFAMFAREELGKGRILVRLWREAVAGRVVNSDEMVNTYEDHIDRQREAQLSTVQRTRGDDRLARLLRTLFDPQSPNFANALQELNEIAEQQRRRMPGTRHRLRLRALYVDPDDAGTGWNRPAEFDQERARDLVQDAANDYANQRDQLQVERLRAQDPQLAAALERWPERPELPPPRWPRLLIRGG